MKIAYVYYTDLSQKAANVVQTLNMLQALGKQTIQIEFLSSWISHSKRQEILEWFGITSPIHQIRIPVRIYERTWLLGSIGMFIYSAMVWIILKWKEYDLVYTRDFSFLYFLSLLPPKWRTNSRICFETHKIYHLVSQKVSREQEKRALKVADHIVAISGKIKTDLLDQFDIPANRVTVLPNGTDLDLVTATKKDPGKEVLDLKVGQKLVLYSGSFLGWKGADTLLRGIKHVKDKGAVFLLIGLSADQANRIGDLDLYRDSPGRIILKEAVPMSDLYQFFFKASIAVLPNNDLRESKYTSPLKLFEYLGAGLPIVASELPPIREILTEPENCLYFRPGDEKHLATKLDELLDNQPLRDQMAQNNLLLANQYSWDQRAAKLVQYFKNVT